MRESTPERAAGPNAGRTFVVLNPKAGQEAAARLRRQIGGALAARRIPFDIAETLRAGHATELVRAARADGYTRFCVVGGDGTLAEVTTGLAGSECPIALVPRGTANQVALNLGIPIDMEAALDVLVHGVVTEMDLGRIGDRTFALVAGAGLDAAVMVAATRELKERWGFAAYVYAAVKQALTATPIDFHIVADGREVEVRAVSVLIANMGELFAGFLPFSFSLSPTPNSWQDDLLEVVIVAPQSLPDFGAVLWRAARSQFSGDDRLIHFRAREVYVESEPAIDVQIDGDPAGLTPLRAAVAPRAVRILLPA